MAWGPEVEGEDFARELAAPERNWRVGGAFEWGGDDFAVVRDEDLVFVEGQNRRRVGEGEFMENLDDGGEGAGKHEDFWVVDGAEDFLELGKGDDEDGAGFEQKFAFGEESVGGVAG